MFSSRFAVFRVVTVTLLRKFVTEVFINIVKKATFSRSFKLLLGCKLCITLLLETHDQPTSPVHNLSLEFF